MLRATAAAREAERPDARSVAAGQEVTAWISPLTHAPPLPSVERRGSGEHRVAANYTRSLSPSVYHQCSASHSVVIFGW